MRPPWRFHASVIFTLTLVAALTVIIGPARSADPDRALVRVAVSNQADVKELQATDLHVYTRLNTADGQVLLAGVNLISFRDAAARGLDVRVLDAYVRDEPYYVVYRLPRLGVTNLAPYGRVLYEDKEHAVVQMSDGDALRLAEAGAELRAITLDPKPRRTPSEMSYAPAVITPDPFIQTMIDQVDSATLYNYTGDLSGEWQVLISGSPYTIDTRYTYSGTPIQKATQYVGEHLEALGLTVEYHEWNDPTYPNVIGELPGVVSPDTILIVCGHVDDMPSGPVAPGADDNASGTVGVLVAADILSQYQWHYTLRFALWTGEEQGLLGSHEYALRSYNLGEHIEGVLNLDMIAYNTAASVPGIDLHADQSMPETMTLAQLFADVVSVYNLDLVPEIEPYGTDLSDHASFWDYGYTAILGIEDFGDFNPRYHTTGDQLQYLDMDFYVEFVKASVATTAHMAGIYVAPPEVPSSTAPARVMLGLLLALVGLLGAMGMRHGRRVADTAVRH